MWCDLKGWLKTPPFHTVGVTVTFGKLQGFNTKMQNLGGLSYHDELIRFSRLKLKGS